MPQLYVMSEPIHREVFDGSDHDRDGTRATSA